MEFKTIFEKQILLDEAIEKAHNVSKDQTKNKKILALIVEIAEFANEIEPFKYWKKNKKQNETKILEEFVDAIHFFISLGSFFKIKTFIEPKIVAESQTEQLLAIYSALGMFAKEANKKNLTEAFCLYMGMAKILKITDKSILANYENKNKINFQRIANNY